MSKKDDYLEAVNADKLSSDSDHTKKAREFYVRFWGGVLEDYKGEIGLFRGETIITFMTVSGCLIRTLSCFSGRNMPKTSRERLDFIANSEEVSDCMKESFTRFFKLYLTRANFMPLVHAGKKHSLNLAKGSAVGKYHDFPDLFFRDVYNYIYAECSGEHRIFDNAINRQYFDEFVD